MFRKYDKTFRVVVPQINVRGKFYLSDKDTKRLLGGNVVITEKLDGANVGIIRHKDMFKLQKRGSLVDQCEHEQFNFFRNWAWEHVEGIMKIPKDMIAYGELLRCVHTVQYDKLPDWVCIFAIWSKKHDEYLKWDEVFGICGDVGLQTVPIITRGTFHKMDLFDMIPDVSAYGSQKAEGIVIYNHRQQLRGKIVREEFVKDMEESDHWRDKPLVFNKLRA